MNFTFQESSVLYGMLAESSTDVILKTDPKGFIVHATPESSNWATASSAFRWRSTGRPAPPRPRRA
ncbi:hypothetical protein ACFSLT_00405 [Novosphingobium resinovorum]